MSFRVLRRAVLVLVTLSGRGVPDAEPRGVDELLKASNGRRPPRIRPRSDRDRGPRLGSAHWFRLRTAEAS